MSATVASSAVAPRGWYSAAEQREGTPDMQIVEAINALEDVFTRRALKCLQHVEIVGWTPETDPGPCHTGLVDWQDLPTHGGFQQKWFGARGNQRRTTPEEKTEQTQCYARHSWGFR